MADVFDPAKRSEIMSKIRSENTRAEMLAFAYLRKEGIYFQRHYSRISGKPDIAQPRRKRAVFIDGDFWHGRDPARIEKLPKEYWQQKISGNVKRDAGINAIMHEKGWKVLRIWERDIIKKATREDTLIRLKTFLIS
jgi:DNA mismatch endonuclease (patch repair protein)